MAPQSLTELANYYGTDKGTIGPSSHWVVNNYSDVYEAYLGKYRHRAVNILEIGLGVTGDKWDAKIVHGRNAGGASVRMWYDYFPRGGIYGIDVNRCSYLDNDRIKTFVVDQGNVDDLQTFSEATHGIDFDFIIDDGSHRPDHQQVSFSYLFKRLKRGGLYFIEDLAANGLGDGARGRHACEVVRNTRRVLKQFLMDGGFLEPNALMDPDFLRENIDYLHFHVPKVDVAFGFGASLRRPLSRFVRYQGDSEKLCAIGKK